MAIMRLPEVLRYTGLSKGTIYNLIASDAFPRPIKLGPQATGWIDREIDEWVEQRVLDRDAT